LSGSPLYAAVLSKESWMCRYVYIYVNIVDLLAFGDFMAWSRDLEENNANGAIKGTRL
jgi:hypothetical protein